MSAEPLRIVVTGREGQVARALAERGRALGIEVVPVGRPMLDLAAPATILPALAAAAPQVIVNAAAYTAVDKAESEPELAHAVNAAGAGAVAAAAARLGVPVVHLSTDYVFDGHIGRPHREEDAPAPVNVYGRSKLAGEAAVAAAAADHAILRVAWVYSPFGRNFVRTMLALAASRDVVRVVADQRGAPTSALAIADGVIALARNLVARPGDRALHGLFHMSAAGDATWADLAEAVFAESATRGGPSARVERIGTADYPTPAARAPDTRLDCSRIEAVHGVALPHWRISLAEVVARCLAGEEGKGKAP